VKTVPLRTLLLTAITLVPLVSKADGTQPNAIEVTEYRVEGVRTLPAIEVEKTVYPYLGPARTSDDVEKARAALEKAYQDKGYKTVSVVIPAQKVENGIVTLQVIEGKVGRLRVRGSQYSDLDEIKKGAPSLAEGKTPDFDAVQRDIVALNKSADRQVTPEIKAGAEPGTIDVDLVVKDKPALHGSLEFNNRHNADTEPLRINGALHYDNLWQLGHSIGGNFQVAPQQPDNAQVYSAFYTAKGVGFDWLDLTLSGTKSYSNVNTIGNVNVNGPGETVGLRATATLPGKESYFHTFSAGIDYKHSKQDIGIPGSPAINAPISYFPMSAEYSATKFWADGSLTQFNLGVTWHFDGVGDNAADFENRRAGARADFAYFRGDISHTQELPGAMQLWAQLQAQAASGPLVSNEQFGIGGLTTVRGYLESEAIGDNALAFSAELRSPNLTCDGALDEWRVYGFVDWGGSTVSRPAAGQQSRFELASVGIGTRLKFADHFSASADLGVPLADGPRTAEGNVNTGILAGSPFVTFTLKAEF